VASSTQKADPKDLFADLIGECSKLADSTQTVEKSAYTRVDVLFEGGKHKTLAYVNNPSSKAVRVEVPKKGGGGYDVIRVEKPTDVAKAVKAVTANRDRILAAQAAA
jgi:hypothetical protein